jgi:hypothetical protein
MAIYVRRNGELIDKRDARPLTASGVAPGVISDNMDATRHMADGRFYTSKSKFRQATKAAGCIEVGNDPAISRPRPPVKMDRGARRDAIRRAIYDIRNGRGQ